MKHEKDIMEKPQKHSFLRVTLKIAHHYTLLLIRKSLKGRSSFKTNDRIDRHFASLTRDEAAIVITFVSCAYVNPPKLPDLVFKSPGSIKVNILLMFPL